MSHDIADYVLSESSKRYHILLNNCIKFVKNFGLQVIKNPLFETFDRHKLKEIFEQNCNKSEPLVDSDEKIKFPKSLELQEFENGM